MFNQSTDAVAQWGSGIPGFASSLAAMTNGQFIMAAGGWPIRLGGATIGGIGVSGGNAPGRYEEIARAGLAAINATPVAPAQPPIPAQSYAGGQIPQPPVSAPYAFPGGTPASQPYHQGWIQEEAHNENESQRTRQFPPDQDNSYGNHTLENLPTDLEENNHEPGAK